MSSVLKAILRGILTGGNTSLLMLSMWQLSAYRIRKSNGFEPETAWGWAKVIIPLIYVMANIVVLGIELVAIVLPFIP